jgi:GH15 family glucan-1,4-alpha-glucosidase
MSAASTADTPLAPPQRTDGYAPLRDYAAIGDRRTLALVARDGAIDWLPLPAFDGPTAFAALLDSRKGGRATLAPAVRFAAARRYLPGTNVLETTFTTAAGTVRVTDAMSHPWDRRLGWSEVVRRVEGVAGRVPMAWSAEPRFGYGQDRPRIERRDGVPLLRCGALTLAVQSCGAGEPQPAEGGVAGRFEVGEGEVAALGLSAFDGPVVTISSRAELLERLDATVRHWEGWSARCSYDGPWREAVLRSALALDLLVDRETGAIAAAGTMGLPERLGGERNFDYRYAWLRDGNLTLEAMLHLGYGERVHDSIAWLLGAIARTHPRLEPIYRLDGTPSVPQRELPLAGYRGSRPVTLGNSAEGQLQLGNYGDVLNMAFNQVDRGNALAGGAGVRLAELADFVCRIWRNLDAGLWELGQERAYTQSKLACWLALERAAHLAARGHLPAAHAPRWRATAREIDAFVQERCWSERLRSYVRSAGSEELDAAVLLAARGPFLDAHPERVSATIDAVRRELGAGGPLVYRYSGMQEQENAFLACSFWIVEALARVGRREEAAATMDELVALADDVGLYPEEMDPADGAFRGNFPQALTHLSLILAAKACQSG